MQRAEDYVQARQPMSDQMAARGKRSLQRYRCVRVDSCRAPLARCQQRRLVDFISARLGGQCFATIICVQVSSPSREMKRCGSVTRQMLGVFTLSTVFLLGHCSLLVVTEVSDW